MNTHMISWNEYDNTFAIFIVKSVKATAESVELIVKDLRDRMYDQHGDQMISSITVRAI